MGDLRDDLRLLVATPSDDVRAVYARAAPRYEAFRELWLTIAGEEAERAMLGDLTRVLEPRARVLDAGSGTGALSRQMLAVCPAIDLTMIDLSPEMLALTADIPAERLLGSVLELPFADGSFDVVVSAWVIETVPDPMLAVRELLRVLAPSGRLVYTFCSLPDGWLSRAGSALLRAGVKRGFAGEFLAEERTSWHDCGRSHRRRFRGGLTTEIALAKCCAVGPGVLPGQETTRALRGENRDGRARAPAGDRVGAAAATGTLESSHGP